MDDRYTHGHHDSVLRSHRWRTAENSAGHLLPHLRAGMRILDVGCGPGTITLDLARRVAPGEVVGIDSQPTVIDGAEADRVRRGTANAAFAVADVLDPTSWPPGPWDVVHMHQLLHHLRDPVSALANMAGALGPGGLLSVRESDFGAFCWHPADPRLDRWMELFHQMTRAHGSEVDAGRHLLGWAHEAGLTDLTCSSSTWTFATPEDRSWWGATWAERVVSSGFADQALELGLSDRSELEELSAAFREWADHDDAVFIVVHGELLARIG